MATIHFILQGKGGVGKSMIAALLCQGLAALGHDVRGYDTDPVNATFAAYREFNVSSIDIMRGEDIDKRSFDTLLNELAETPEGVHSIVDNGASSFIALGAYLAEYDILNGLQEMGHRIFFHSVVVGGQALGDTVQGLSKLLRNFPDIPIVAWLNPYFGEIRMNGTPFEEFKIYQENRERFRALVYLPETDKDTLGRDLANLYAGHRSFAAGMREASFSEKIRLRRYWEQFLASFGKIAWN